MTPTQQQEDSTVLLCRDRELSARVHNVLTVLAAVLSLASLTVMAGTELVGWKLPCIGWNLVAVCLWLRGRPWIAA